MGSPQRDQPPALHDRAIQDLSFIRRTMEGAASFTDVPGWGLVVVGGTAILAAAFAARQPTAARWLAIWLAEAVVALTLSLGAMALKMRRRAAAGAALSIPARKFLLGPLPALVAGAVLTFALAAPHDLNRVGPESLALLPGLWLLLHGVGVISAGAFSVRPVPLLGVTLILTGTLALLIPGADGDVMMALGFGVAQIGVGTYIAQRHGG